MFSKSWVRNFLVLTAFACVQTVGAQDASPTDAVPCRASNITLPAAAPRNGEVRFIAVGDTGRGCDEIDDPQCRVSARMLEVQKRTGFDLFLLLGDNVYNSGQPEDFFEKLYDPYKSLHSAGILIKGVVGNHDVRSREGTAIQMKFLESADVSAQAKFFSLPIAEQAKLPGGERTYYSFTRGGDLAEFFAVDSSMLTDDCCGFLRGREYPAADKAAQIEWLRTGLKNSRAKWKIVLLHHPLYSSSKEHGVKVGKDGTIEVPREMQAIRQIEPIFVENGVKLVLTAHDHVYERIKPQRGVQYIVSGGGSDTRAEDLDRRMPDFHLCGESRKSSFTLFNVRRDALDFWAIDDAGTVFDSSSISYN